MNSYIWAWTQYNAPLYEGFDVKMVR